MPLPWRRLRSALRRRPSGAAGRIPQEPAPHWRWLRPAVRPWARACDCAARERTAERRYPACRRLRAEPAGPFADPSAVRCGGRSSGSGASRMSSAPGAPSAANAARREPVPPPADSVLPGRRAAWLRQPERVAPLPGPSAVLPAQPAAQDPPAARFLHRWKPSRTCDVRKTAFPRHRAVPATAAAGALHRR